MRKKKVEKSRKRERQNEVIDGQVFVFLIFYTSLRRCPIGQILLMVKRVGLEGLAPYVQMGQGD